MHCGVRNLSLLQFASSLVLARPAPINKRLSMLTLGRPRRMVIINLFLLAFSPLFDTSLVC